jgi:hypothetical protein
MKNDWQRQLDFDPRLFFLSLVELSSLDSDLSSNPLLFPTDSDSLYFLQSKPFIMETPVL